MSDCTIEYLPTTEMSWKKCFLYYFQHTNLPPPKQIPATFLNSAQDLFSELVYSNKNKVMILGWGEMTSMKIRGYELTDTVPYPSPPSYILHDRTEIL